MEGRYTDAAYPLSLSMPLVVAEHEHARVEPWLWGLLPDNEAILALWGQRFHVSPRNAFALLGAVGEDCPGAVQLVRPDRVDDLLDEWGATSPYRTRPIPCRSITSGKSGWFISMSVSMASSFPAPRSNTA